MEIISAFSLPPGFGFHPTDVELISHYLKKKILGLKIDFEVIPEVDIYKYEPWDLPAKCRIPTRDSKWHFFTSRDRKYPNGSRSNRATEAGYWKSTGKDRNIRSHNRVIGTKKTLVFHEGRPPCGKRTDWIMHEYYMDEDEFKAAPGMKDLFVLCRVTKRNGLAYDGENAYPKNEEIDACPKPPKDVTVSEVQEESSPSETVDDLEAWFSELYDPDFCGIPTIGELKSEPEEDFNSLALKQELVDFRPKFSEGLHLLQSGDDIYSILQSDISIPNSGLFEEVNIGALDVSSSPQFIDGLRLDDLYPPIHAVGGYTDSHENSFIDGNGSRQSAAFDSTASNRQNDNIDSGVLIRERRRKPTEIPSYKIKLQVHKMESKNGGSVNQTVKFVSQDHHLDLNNGHQYPARIEVEENHSCEKSSVSYQAEIGFKGSTDSEGSQSGPSTTPNTGQILMAQASMLQKRSICGPPNVERNSSTHPDDMSCIQGLVRGLLIFLHWCSSSGMNCFFLGTCMMGTVAVILYFLLRDVRRFLGLSSALGL